MSTEQQESIPGTAPGQSENAGAKRVFVYDGKKFPDPDPTASITQVRDVLRGAFPELAEAEADETKLEDGTRQITFRKVAGRKGR